MKKTYLFFLLAMLAIGLNSQTRYLKPVFTDVGSTLIPYGQNSTVLGYPTIVKQPLVMDLYQPVGDTETKRPLVIYLHTGNFLPFKSPIDGLEVVRRGGRVCGGFGAALLDESLEHRVRRAAGAAHTGCTSAGPLFGEPTAQGLFLLSTGFRVAGEDITDLQIALVFEIAVVRPLSLPGQRHVEADRGQAADGTHQVKSLTSGETRQVVIGKKLVDATHARTEVPATHPPKYRVASEVTPLWHATEAWLASRGIDPPFWAFPWAGGQVLARYLLDTPAEVRDLRVLDFASGSGLVAIAAARAGAREVVAVDIDPLAIAATELNAEASGVSVAARAEDVTGHGLADRFDVVLAGDVFYDRDLAARGRAWLLTLADRGAHVLVGDPSRGFLDLSGLRLLATYRAGHDGELRDDRLKDTAVFVVPPGISLESTPP